MASACGMVSAILRSAIFWISRFPNRELIAMPVTVVSVEAEACTGEAVAEYSSRKNRRRAPRLVTPRLLTVTGPCEPRVSATLVAANTRSNAARSDDGTKSSRTLPRVRPLPRTLVPSTTSSTGIT